MTRLALALLGAAALAAAAAAVSTASPLARVDAQEAWTLVQGHVVPPVAVLDTGIDASHPDLAGKVEAARDFVDPGGDVTDQDWHGTAVAGVIAAADGSVCPSCPLVSAKVLDARGSGDDGEIARGVLWAVAAGARVINLSMSGPTEAPALRAAIRTATRRGVVVVAAAGNDGSSTRSFPAADPNVIGVAATTGADRLYGWSNRGSWVSLAAPGVTQTTLRGGGYTTFTGTSAAAPAVAAAAAECLAVAPQLTPRDVRRLLARTAAPVVGMPFGRLDVGRAVRACAAA